MHTLLDFHFRPHIKADNGKGGAGSNRDGANGGDLVLKVPDGTVVLSSDGEVLADLIGAGTTFEVARGGRGGRGNASLANTRRKAPGFAELGEPGDELDVVLELKSVADVGLVGFPSAGKSSLISVISAAKPKIADYPFTTLVPNLGVVRPANHTFTVADVPGPDPGRGHRQGARTGVPAAHRALLGAGARGGHRDPGDRAGTRSPTSTRSRPSWPRTADWPTGPGSSYSTRSTCPDGRDLADIVRADLEARGCGSSRVSAATRDGLRELTFALAELVEQHRAAAPVLEPTRIVLRPRRGGRRRASPSRPHADGAYVVHGPRPERWVRQTNFDNDEAVGYLADRLARLGVEDEARQGGRRAGQPGPDRRTRVRLAADPLRRCGLHAR